MSEVDVFISNYTIVDKEIYQLWVEGHAASDAVSILNQRGICQTTNASLELIATDVLDHYRTYSLLEKLLSNPNKLQEQVEFQIESHEKQLLIEIYYEFDDNVIRELLGKKLSSRNRKDLDEVADKTGVPLRSCRRQFDNVKRVFKMVEDMSGSVVKNIKKLFFLPEEMARRYGCVVFLACLRFETSKRRLQYLKFDTIRKCTEVIMEHWTYPITPNSPNTTTTTTTAPTTTTGADYYDTELDKEFLLELRELRSLSDREKEHKHLVCVSLKPTLLSKSYSDMDGNFRTYSRGIITLANNLHRSRELRNLFVEISLILEVWKQNGWASKDLQLFLNAYTQCAHDLDVLRDPELKGSWERYMKVLSQCIIIMYG